MSKLELLIFVSLLEPHALMGQAVCPPIDFLTARQFVMYNNSLLNAPLVREADGSYTLYPHTTSPPFRRSPGALNYQQWFTNCLPAPRPGATPLVLNGRSPGDGSSDVVMFPNVGNGTAAGAFVEFSGTAFTVYQLNPDYTYKTKTAYEIGERNGMLPGDFNGDGKPDIAVSGYGPTGNAGFIAVLLGKGDGTFEQAVKSPTGADLPGSFAAADFNGDGKLDVAVVHNSGVVVMAGNGNGTLRAGTAVQTGQNPTTISAADLNGDGRIDLAVGDGFAGNVIVVAGNGDGTFRAPATFPALSYPRYIAVGDFNKDGNRDLAVGSSLGIAVLLGSGNAVFQSPKRYVLGYEPDTLVLVDFNRDGNLDIVAGEGIPEALAPVADFGYMGVLLGNGDGTFVGAQLYLTGSSPQSFAMADFNGDGHLDFVTANLNDATLLLATHDGGFEAPQTLLGKGTVAAGDFNGDGKMDLALSGGSGTDAAVIVLPGNGNGTFQNGIRIPVRNTVVSLTAGDFNGDRRTDIAAVFAGFRTVDPSGVRILLQQASGGFQAGQELTAGSLPGRVVTTDLNGDGRPDLVVTDTGDTGSDTDAGGVLTFVGKGDGTFQNAVTYPAGIHPRYIQTGDLNGDGRLDLVATTSGPNFTNRLAVFITEASGALRPAVLVPADFGPNAVAIADFNNDGKKDVIVAYCCGETDMAFMLGNGDGTLGPATHFAGADGLDLIAADFGGDNRRTWP